MSVQNKLKKPEFSRGVMGYSPIEVDRYIDRVIARYDDVCRENAMLKEKLSILSEINSLRGELNACQARFEAESAAKPDLSELRELVSAENVRRRDFESCLIGFISDVFAKEEEGRASFENALCTSLEKLGVSPFDVTEAAPVAPSAEEIEEAKETETSEETAEDTEEAELSFDELISEAFAAVGTTPTEEAKPTEATEETVAETETPESENVPDVGIIIDEAASDIETALATLPERPLPVAVEETPAFPVESVEIVDEPVLCTATPTAEVFDAPEFETTAEESTADFEVEFFDATEVLAETDDKAEATPAEEKPTAKELSPEERFALDFYTEDELDEKAETDFSDDAIKKALEKLVMTDYSEAESDFEESTVEPEEEGAPEDISDFYIPGEAKEYEEEDTLFKDLQKLMDLIEEEYPEEAEAPAHKAPEEEDTRTPAERAAALDFYTDDVHEDGESFDAMTLAARHTETKRPTYRDFFGNIIDAGMTDND